MWIAYGYPGPEMTQAADRGEIRLGGCLVGPESPDFECLDCGSALPWVADEGPVAREHDEAPSLPM